MSPLVSLALLSFALMGDPVGAEGTVVDANGNPVANAMVLLTGWGRPPESGFYPVLVSTTTDAQGRFQLPGPPAEAFRAMPSGTIWAYHPGLAIGAAHYSPRAATPDLKIPLREAGRTVVALKRKDGRPIAGAQVTAMSTTAPNVRGFKSTGLPEALAGMAALRTDEKGEAVFDSFEPRFQPAIFQIESEEAGTQMLPVPDRAQLAARRIEYVIEPAGSLRGTISLGDGKPAGEIRVKLERETQRSGGVEPVERKGSPIVTTVDGTFASPPILLEGGRYRVGIQKDGYAPAFSEWVTPAGAENSVELKPIMLRALVSVSGRVVDRQGKPLAGIEVSQAGDGPARTTAKTDANGRFTLDGFSAARGLVFAHAEGFRHGGAILKDGMAEITLTRLTETPERSLTRRMPLPPEELRAIARKALTPFIVDALKSNRPSNIYRSMDALAVFDPISALKTIEPLAIPDKVGLLLNIVEALAADDPAMATKVADALPDASSRIEGLLIVADALPTHKKAERVGLLKKALGILREQKSKEMTIAELGGVAERLEEEDEIEESRKAFDEGLALQRRILLTPEGLPFTAALAKSRPETALALIAEADPKDLPTDGMSNLTLRLAVSRPEEVAKLWATFPGFRTAPPMIALERMAAVDAARAGEILDTMVEPERRGHGRLLIAHGLAKSNPAEAERVFHLAIEELSQQARSSVFVRNSLGFNTTFVEEISPSLVPEFLWLTLAMRPPATADDTQLTPRETRLATIVAQYDTEIAAAVWQPIDAVVRSSSKPEGSARDMDIVNVLAWLDPKKALEWIETRPGPDGTMGLPADDPSRPHLAQILGRISRRLPQPMILGHIGFADQVRFRNPYE